MKDLLEVKFSLNGLFQLKLFLGFEIARSQQSLSKKICSSSSTRYNKAACCQVNFHTNELQLDSISYAVSLLSQFLLSPTILHHQPALLVLRYVKGAHGKRFIIPCKLNSSTLRIYWLWFRHMSRYSQFYYRFFASSWGHLVLWESKRQSTVS